MWTYRVEDPKRLRPLKRVAGWFDVYVIIAPDGWVSDYVKTREEAREYCAKRNRRK